jgi:hypothetical protein
MPAFMARFPVDSEGKKTSFCYRDAVSTTFSFMKVPRIFSLLGFASLFALFLSDSVQAENTVTLYTQRHYEFDEKLHEEFTEKTGIKVEVVKATADELIARLEQEGENSPADLFMTADAGGLDRASKAGLFAAMPASLLESVPDRLHDPESLWTAITQTSSSPRLLQGSGQGFRSLHLRGSRRLQNGRVDFRFARPPTSTISHS